MINGPYPATWRHDTLGITYGGEKNQSVTEKDNTFDEMVMGGWFNNPDFRGGSGVI